MSTDDRFKAAFSGPASEAFDTAFPDFGVSLQVREEACEAAAIARLERNYGKGTAQHFDPLVHIETQKSVEPEVRAAIPVIAGAAYKEAKARIEGLVSDLFRTEQYDEFDEGWNDALGAILDNLRAALAAIDKEGEERG